MNRELAAIFSQTAELLRIKGDSAFRIGANEKVARILAQLPQEISETYRAGGVKAIQAIRGIGKSSAQKIEEYIKKGRIAAFEKLQEETAIRQLVTHFFASKGLSLQELKESAKKRKIIYSRFTKPAKQLLELAGSVQAAKEAIDKVAAWANSRKLDYTIETVFKKWLELDRLKPKEIVRKPFYQGDPMVFSEARKKWYVISKNGEWLLFAGKEKEIEWREIE